jgi:hypothetical protein
MVWIWEVEMNFICQFWIFLLSRRAQCLPVLGYLIDCPWPFKILGRIELVLKTNCFCILWITHFIQLLNFWSIQWTVSLNCVLFVVICYDQFHVHSMLDLWNICMYEWISICTWEICYCCGTWMHLDYVCG